MLYNLEKKDKADLVLLIIKISIGSESIKHGGLHRAIVLFVFGFTRIEMERYN